MQCQYLKLNMIGYSDLLRAKSLESDKCSQLTGPSKD